jgi:uncharacterized membrane protein HdeD (DUF308 family)
MNEEMVSKWGLVVLRGLLGILMGLLLIAWPTRSLVLVTWFTGLYLLIDGVITCLQAIFLHKKYEHAGILFIQGIVTLFLGLLVYAYPIMSIGLLYFLLAIWILVSGFVMIIQAFRMRREVFSGEWLLAAGGVIAILLAVFLMANPTETIKVAMVLIGALILVAGIFGVAYGFQLKSFKGDLKQLSA